jgi:hypothetical protein
MRRHRPQFILVALFKRRRYELPTLRGVAQAPPFFRIDRKRRRRARGEPAKFSSHLFRFFCIGLDHNFSSLCAIYPVELL